MNAAEPSGSVSWSAASQSEALEPGGSVLFETENRTVSMAVRMDEDGTVRGYPMLDGVAVPLQRLCVWRDGEKVQDSGTGSGGIAAVLVEEEGRFACFFCSPNLCDSMLVRLFVCADRTIPGIKLLGSWENAGNGDPCPAERRIHPAGRTGQYVQVWEAEETLPGAAD